MKITLGTRIIKAIEDVDFGVVGDYDITYGECKFKCNQKHGTVIYVAGLVEENENILMCLGAEKGKDKEHLDFQIALYPPFLEFDKKWRDLMEIKED